MKIVTGFAGITEFETINLFARKMSATDFDLILPMYQNQGFVAYGGFSKVFDRTLCFARLNTKFRQITLFLI